MKLKQQVDSEGYKNNVTEYLPVSKGDAENRNPRQPRFPKEGNTTQKSWKTNKEDRVKELRQ